MPVSTVFVLLITLLVINYVQGMASLVKVPSKPPSLNIKFVTSVEGKSYFAEYTPHRTWSEAAAYCKSMNMKHASIDTPGQFNALKAAFSNDFALSHWTSARDAKKLRQFSWHESDAEVFSDFEFQPEHSNLPFQTCLIYHSSRDSHFYPGLCSGKSGTLCEI